MREVHYEVDGTAKFANLTLRNQSGATEQIQVKLPSDVKFYAKGGQFLYLSAQKVRVARADPTRIDGRIQVLDDGIAGTVHVLIRVSGTVVQEASSSSPYGIATAEQKLPE